MRFSTFNFKKTGTPDCSSGESGVCVSPIAPLPDLDRCRRRLVLRCVNNFDGFVRLSCFLIFIIAPPLLNLMSLPMPLLLLVHLVSVAVLTVVLWMMVFLPSIPLKMSQLPMKTLNLAVRILFLLFYHHPMEFTFYRLVYSLKSFQRFRL